MSDRHLEPIIDLLSTREGLLRLCGTVLYAVFATLLMLALQSMI
jgi:hypothetical protein